AGRDRVGGDAVLRQLAGLADGQPPDRGLHRPVDRVPAPGPQLLVDRGYVDYPPATTPFGARSGLGDHLAGRDLAVQEGGLEARVEALEELLLGHVQVRARGA